jgi:general stress protein 26
MVPGKWVYAIIPSMRREGMDNPNLKNAIDAAEISTPGPASPDLQWALSEGLKLIERSKICLLGTNGPDGIPNIKAMLNLKHKGLKRVWFSTNTTSRRVQQLKQDPRACIYYVDEDSFQGLMLNGTVEVRQDSESRKMLWMDGAEVYYPLGVEDPDYSVLCFTAQKGNYYHGLKNVDFKIE